MIRLLDFVFALFGGLLLLPLLLLLCLIGLFDTGAPLFCQRRVGLRGKTFTLVKFRTMARDTAQVATHLADADQITRFGHILRRTKLDELPQLWNVLRGEMSLVGPRPCLPTQAHLVELRQNAGVLDVRPGITGLAQVQNIDMSTPEKLVRADAEMIRTLSLTRYFTYILQTVTGSGQGDRVK